VGEKQGAFDPIYKSKRRDKNLVMGNTDAGIRGEKAKKGVYLATGEKNGRETVRGIWEKLALSEPPALVSSHKGAWGNTEKVERSQWI